MEAPAAFRFPPPRDANPLQSLSPERVNNTATRAPSGLSSSTAATKSSRTTADADVFYPDPSSAHSSPTRRVANLFSDYHPRSPSPNKTNGFALPQSPSLPEINALRGHVRTNSDVQGLVKRFEVLDVRDKDAEAGERRRKHEAELGRAVMAREEAESDVRKLREEMRRMRKEGEEGRDRERRVSRRLEMLMEEYATLKDTHTTSSSVYEKELRKSRKEAFKSSSLVLKLQEELKSTRNSLRIVQSGFELEKQKVHRSEQETFSAQYQFVAVQEEVERLKVRLETVEDEREALRSTLKEEEVARMAAEGMIALPVSREDDDDVFSSPQKTFSPRKQRRLDDMDENKENLGALPSKKQMDNRRLEQDLRLEQTRREHAEEMLDFLRLECMFSCCACRVAKTDVESCGLGISVEMAEALEVLGQDMGEVLPTEEQHSNAPASQPDVEVSVLAGTPAADEREGKQGDMLEDTKERPRNDTEVEIAETVIEESAAEPDDLEIPAMADHNTPTPRDPDENADDDRSVTLAPEEESNQDPEPDATLSDQIASEPTTAEAPTDEHPPHPPSPTLAPQTPLHPQHRPHTIRTITTTTTVPTHFTPLPSKPMILSLSPSDTENQPPLDTGTPSFDRAAALAAIEYRRGRAKSLANGHLTPRKQMLEGVGLKERRDVSAPALGGKVGGMGVAKGSGSGSVGRRGGRLMGY